MSKYVINSTTRKRRAYPIVGKPNERLLSSRIQRIDKAGASLGALFGISTFAQGDHIPVDYEIAISRRGGGARVDYRPAVPQSFGVAREIGVDYRFGPRSFFGIRQS